jgi:hypothetical protein
MPTVYSRVASGVMRGNWTQSDLRRVSELVGKKTLSIRAAAKAFNIPERTLRRRIKKNYFRKRGKL